MRVLNNLRKEKKTISKLEALMFSNQLDLPLNEFYELFYHSCTAIYDGNIAMLHEGKITFYGKIREHQFSKMLIELESEARNMKVDTLVSDEPKYRALYRQHSYTGVQGAMVKLLYRR